ncbi:MAG: PIN domain-containing protein [Oscillospiraceae bacterium]
MKVLIDTNILLDYLTQREPYFQDVLQVVTACKGDLQGCIAAHSVSNIFYILRHDIPEQERRKLLIAMCQMFDVIGIDQQKLLSALHNQNFKDMEDCLQMECAVSFGADYIVTRNVKDFVKSSIPVVTPEEFVLILKKGA